MRIEVVRKVCYSADLDDIYDQFDWDSIRESYGVKPWEGLTRNQVHDALCDELTNMFMSDIECLLDEDDDDFDLEIHGEL